MYTTTITQSGQITLTKAARDLLQVKPGDKVTLVQGRKGLTIQRRLTDEEFFSQMDALGQGRGGVVKDAEAAVREYREGKVPQVREYYRQKYRSKDE